MESLLRRLNLGYLAAAAGVALVVGVLALPPLRALRPVGVGLQPEAAARLPEETWDRGLDEGRTVTQTLLPVKAALSEIDLYLNSHGHVYLDPIKLEVLDGERVVRTSLLVVPPKGIDEFSFPFEPIADSNHLALSVRLSMVGAVNQSMVSPYVVRGDFVGPRMEADGTPQDVAMPLRLRYGPRRPIWTQFDAMVSRASQYHPWPFKGNGLRAILAVSLAFALGMILYLGGFAVGQGLARPKP